MNKWFFIVSIIFLSGCSTLGKPLTLEYKQSIKNMAVVSVMGDDFQAAKAGTTLFNNQYFKENFSDFGLDTKIEESIVKYLKDHSGINASARPDIKEEFRGAFGYKSNPKNSLERLKTRLGNLKSEGIDAVLVISPEFGDFEDTGISVDGYGLTVRTFLMIWYAKEYFICKFTLVDTSSTEMVFDYYWQKWKEIKFSKWQDSFSKLTTSEQQDFRDFLNNVVRSDIPKFLEKFNF